MVARLAIQAPCAQGSSASRGRAPQKNDVTAARLAQGKTSGPAALPDSSPRQIIAVCLHSDDSTKSVPWHCQNMTPVPRWISGPACMMVLTHPGKRPRAGQGKMNGLQPESAVLVGALHEIVSSVANSEPKAEPRGPPSTTGISAIWTKAVGSLTGPVSVSTRPCNNCMKLRSVTSQVVVRVAAEWTVQPTWSQTGPPHRVGLAKARSPALMLWPCPIWLCVLSDRAAGLVNTRPIALIDRFYREYLLVKIETAPDVAV